MPNAPKDTTQKNPKSNSDAQGSSERKKPTEQIAGGETAAEIFRKKITGDPRFVEVKNSRKGFVIVGAKP
jgi:hypothetical protein